MAFRFRLDPRFRPHVVLAAGAFVASIATHGAVSVVAPVSDRIESPTPAPSNELDFFEVEALAPEPEERTAQVVDEPRPAPARRAPPVHSTPGGLLVAQGADPPRLSLSHTERSGPFAVRDRLTIGRLTPRIAGPARVRPPAPPVEVPAGNERPDEAVAAETSTDAGQAARAEVGELLDAGVGPSDTQTTEVAAPDAGADPRIAIRAARPSSLEETIDPRRAPGIGGAERLTSAGLRVAAEDLALVLGLDRAVIDRIVRSRASRESSTLLGIRTTLTPADLRSRVVGAFGARDQEIRFEGDETRAVVRTTLGDRAIVVANVGSAIVVASANDEAELDRVFAALETEHDGFASATFRQVDGPDGSPSSDVGIAFVADAGRVVMHVMVTPNGPRPESITPLLGNVLAAFRLRAEDVGTATQPEWEGDVARFRIEITEDAAVRFATQLARVD